MFLHTYTKGITNYNGIALNEYLIQPIPNTTQIEDKLID